MGNKRRGLKEKGEDKAHEGKQKMKEIRLYNTNLREETEGD
jgi:hypothetical protein